MSDELLIEKNNRLLKEENTCLRDILGIISRRIRFDEGPVTLTRAILWLEHTKQDALIALGDSDSHVSSESDTKLVVSSNSETVRHKESLTHGDSK